MLGRPSGVIHQIGVRVVQAQASLQQFGSAPFP